MNSGALILVDLGKIENELKFIPELVNIAVLTNIVKPRQFELEGTSSTIRIDEVFELLKPNKKFFVENLILKKGPYEHFLFFMHACFST